MKLNIDNITLIGAERQFTFNRGLNIITGPIATGKTTLLQCIRGFLGSGLGGFTREARTTITNLAGSILIGEAIYEIVRPFVTTPTAKVDLAGPYEGWRLPAFRANGSSEFTYGQWLMEKLGLPRLEVPTAPSQPDSETSPISINDYLMYCYLRQDEIDNSVFGHTSFPKNTKRKFVFEILYGKYDIKIATLQEERREAYTDLRRLQAQAKTIQEFLSGTPFANRAAIELGIKETDKALAEAEKIMIDNADSAADEYDTRGLSKELRSINEKLEKALNQLQLEERSAEQKNVLLTQLQTQSTRITRSIVAEKYFHNLDFVICPRCGSSVDADRGNIEMCYLCSQHPNIDIGREDLIKEQERLERQIEETRELIKIHEQSIIELKSRITDLKTSRQKISAEIDFRTSSYISDKAERIAEVERQRTELQERGKRLHEYLQLYIRTDESAKRVAYLEENIQDIDGQLEAAISGVSAFNERVQFLEECLRKGLERIKAPRFTISGSTYIDRQTYLPVYDGRRFDELQSPGLQVMVNVAHALAHQLTALHFELPLPSLLLLDGLSGNLGYKGLDLERIEAIYEYMIDIINIHNELQIIVADNTVPSNMKNFVNIEFDESNRLIPQQLLK